MEVFGLCLSLQVLRIEGLVLFLFIVTCLNTSGIVLYSKALPLYVRHGRFSFGIGPTHVVRQ